MALEQHMAEVARLVGEGAKSHGMHGVSGYARVALPIPESPDGTPYVVCIGVPHECTVPVSTSMPAAAAAELVLEAIKGPTQPVQEPPPSTGLAATTVPATLDASGGAPTGPLNPATASDLDLANATPDPKARKGKAG
jgi:hypothetical protein